MDVLRCSKYIFGSNIHMRISSEMPQQPCQAVWVREGMLAEIAWGRSHPCQVLGVAQAKGLLWVACFLWKWGVQTLGLWLQSLPAENTTPDRAEDWCGGPWTWCHRNAEPAAHLSNRGALEQVQTRLARAGQDQEDEGGLWNLVPCSHGANSAQCGSSCRRSMWFLHWEWLEAHWCDWHLGCALRASRWSPFGKAGRDTKVFSLFYKKKNKKAKTRTWL